MVITRVSQCQWNNLVQYGGEQIKGKAQKRLHMLFHVHVCGGIYADLFLFWWFSVAHNETRASFQYPQRRLIVRSREVSKATRFVFRIVRSLWNLTGISAALLPRRLSNFKAIRWYKLPISRLGNITRSYNKTSYRILKRGPGVWALSSSLSRQKFCASIITPDKSMWKIRFHGNGSISGHVDWIGLFALMWI